MEKYCEECGEEILELNQSKKFTEICIYCEMDNRELNREWRETGDFDYSMNY